MTPDYQPGGVWAAIRSIVQQLGNLRIELLGESAPRPLGVSSLSELARRIHTGIEEAVQAGDLAQNARDELEAIRAHFWDGVVARLHDASRTEGDTSETSRIVRDAGIDVPRVIARLNNLIPNPAPPPPLPPSGGPSLPNPPQPMRRAILLFDLARFTRKVSELVRRLPPGTEELRVEAIDYLQNRLEGLVQEAYVEVGGTGCPVFCDTGDGGFLEFETVDLAYRFVEAFHRRAEAHNERVRRDLEGDELLIFHFRTGLSFGPVRFRRPIYFRPTPDRPFTVSVGEPLIQSQRLCSNCRTGQLLVHATAWARWEGVEDKARPPGFGPVEYVRGKPGEASYPARRKQMVPRAEWDSGWWERFSRRLR